MKTNPFAYLKKAPKLKGYRVLKPTEKARAGDRFLYLHSLDDVFVTRPEAIMSAVDHLGYICIDRTLIAARRDGIDRRGHYTEHTYDGVIYRPIKRKSAKK